MRKTVWLALVIALVVVMPRSLDAQGKISSDPNAPGNQVSAPKEKADSRMAQKITYDSGYKRLHAVTDDLSRMTGVDILAGQNKKDWQVRDIPVVVYVKDLPLGKLLRAIADATHTRFASEKIGDSPETSYRIYRRSADQDRLDKHVQKQHESSLEAAAWQWDALTAYGKSNANPPADPSLKETWVMARLIAGLGPDSKDKLLNGDTFTFRGTDPANRAYLEEYYRLLCEKCIDQSRRLGKEISNQSQSYPPWEDVEDTPLQIKLEDTGTEARTMMLFGPFLGGSSGDQSRPFCSISGDLPATKPLQDKVSGLPPRPEAMPIPSMKDDMGNPEMVPILRKGPSDIKSDSFVMAKITLEKPPSVTDFTFAKAIHAIAQAGKCNIVTEDFTSHKSHKYQGIDGILSAPAESTLLDVLCKLERAPSDGRTWSFGEDDRLIVGWGNDWQHTWRDHHANMLSEDYLNGLKTKFNGDGFMLDDAIHLGNLPRSSVLEWIVDSDGFPQIYTWVLDPAWRLYDALKEQDKQLAKSDGGLPLGKFDTVWIVDFFRAEKMRELPSHEPIAPPSFDKQASEDYKQQAKEDTRLNKLALSDPKVISTMLMRIQKKPAKNRYATVGGAGTSVDIPKGLNLSSYEMVITYSMDGESRSIHVPSTYFAFPIWSPEREAEIIKAQAAGAK